MPPRGHYLAHEVGLLAGVSGDRIGQWARRGYITSSQSKGRPRVYSYQDVAEAMVVHELEDFGADLKSIKRAILRLRDRHGTDWPLQHEVLGSVHGSVVEYDGDELYDIGGRGSPVQQVLDAENLRKIAGQLERGGWAVRSLPKLHHIEVNPDRLSGRPSIRGRRIAAADVAVMAAEPDGRERLREGFGLTNAEMEDAVNWFATTMALAS
jgi:uncharacterized protein (DUF433 family)